MKYFIFCIIFVSNYLLAQNIPEIKNVIVIVADDHAMHSTGIYGNKKIRTPSIDRLAEQGILFTNSYCNSPICSASRQSLLTGKYPHSTGVNLLFTPFPDKGNTTIAEHLKKFDYSTALIGKSHFNNWVWWDLYKNGLPKHGFDTLIQKKEYQQFFNSLDRTALPDIDYYEKESIKNNIAEWMNCKVLPQPVFDSESRGTFYAKSAIKFIEDNKNKPFFLWLAFDEPHHPFYFPVEYAGKYKAEEIVLPEGTSEDNRWIPKKYKNLTDKEKQGIIASYYTSMEYLDKNVGLVLSALRKIEISDETLVVYISDNGYLLNHHKRFEKHTMWEEAIKQPMIFNFGSGYKSGSTREGLVEYIDIVPTILEIMNIDPLKEAQGYSFEEILANDNEFREFTFAEYLEDNLAMVTTRTWKYMFTSGRRDLGIGYETGNGPSGINHRLYNLEKDPYETTNLAYKTEYNNILQDLKIKMLNRFFETHPQAKECPNDLTMDGKLSWFCEPRDIGSDQSLEDKPYRIFYNK